MSASDYAEMQDEIGELKAKLAEKDQALECYQRNGCCCELDNPAPDEGPGHYSACWVARAEAAEAKLAIAVEVLRELPEPEDLWFSTSEAKYGRRPDYAAGYEKAQRILAQIDAAKKDGAT